MLFFLSLGSGLVIGAPVGVSGALVADSALAHNLRRLITTVAAVAVGDTVLALIIGFFCDLTESFMTRHGGRFNFAAGIFLIVIAVVMFISAFRGRALPDAKKIKGPVHYILTHAAPAFAPFLISVFHPGSILFMIPLLRWIILKTGIENFNPWVFAAGIGIGSLIIFAFSAFFFWKIRQKAGKFVCVMRFLLAGAVIIMGSYLIFT